MVKNCRKAVRPSESARMQRCALAFLKPSQYIQHLMAKVYPEPNTGCWLWAGAADYKGYSKVGKYRGEWAVHRIMYKVHRGPIKRGLLVCHTCDVPGCVNPDHLFLGTAKQNTKDCIDKGRFAIGRMKLLGRKHTQAAKDKMSANHATKRGEGWVGRKHSEESKQRMRNWGWPEPFIEHLQRSHQC